MINVNRKFSAENINARQRYPVLHILRNITKKGRDFFEKNWYCSVLSSKHQLEKASVFVCVYRSRETGSYNRRGSLQLWQFLVSLLEDPANQQVIAWTGRGLEFKLVEPEEVSFHYIYIFMWIGRMNACSAVHSVSDGKNVFSDLLSVL